MKKSARLSVAATTTPVREMRGDVTRPAKMKAARAKAPKAWFLYVLRCNDRSLYCGIAIDVEKRLEQHRSGKGARYTRGRGPLNLVHVWKLANHSRALKAEWAFKKLSRAQKERGLKKPHEWLAEGGNSGG